MSAVTLRPAEEADAAMLARWGIRGPDDRANAIGGSTAAPSPESGERLWLAMDGPHCLAACTSHVRTAWIDGQARTTAVLDLPWEAPEQTERLLREDVTAQLARALLDATYTGPEGDFLVGALVHEDHAERMQALFGLEVARTQGRLTRTVTDVPAPHTSRQSARELTTGLLGEPDIQVRWLWERCAGSLTISTIRDAARLDDLLHAVHTHRVAPETPVSTSTQATRSTEGTQAPKDSKAPEAPKASGHMGAPAVRAIGTRDADGVLRALAVLAEHADEHGSLLVWDWLVAEDEPDAADALLQACQQRARDAGVSRLAWMLPAWSPWFAWLQDRGAVAGPSRHLLLGRTDLSRYDAFWLRDHWWAQPLDWANNGWTGTGATTGVAAR